MSLARTIISISALVAALSPGLAQADQHQDAVAIFREAVDQYDVGEYEAAYLLFREAAATYPAAALPKHKMALSLDRLGRYDEAIAAYEDFIAHADDPRFSERVRASQKRIAELTDRAESPPAPPAPEPTAADEAALAGELVASAALSDSPPPPPPTEQPATEVASEPQGPSGAALGLQITGFVALSGALAVGAATAVYAARSQTEATFEARDAARRTTIVLGPIAGTLALLSVIALPVGFNLDDSPDAASALLLPYGGPDGGGLSAHLRF